MHNIQTVESYMDAFRRTDREQVLACLTDDVEWVLPGVFHVKGKDAFNSHIVDEGFTGHPEITLTRTLEAGNVVVAEGSVRAHRSDGTILNLLFCDVFDMRDARIAKVTSYLVVVNR